MNAASKTKVWYFVIALSSLTIIAPFLALIAFGERVHAHDLVVGPIMLTAALYELRKLPRRL